MRTIFKISIIIFIISLLGCKDFSNENNKNSKVEKLVHIDITNTVPVVNGRSTQGVLYIHNYTNSIATNLDFSIETEDKTFNEIIKNSAYYVLDLLGLIKGNSIINSKGFH